MIEKTGLISMPHYVPCTKLLKIRPREEYEAQHPDITHYIWGFEKGSKEENRAKRMVERYPQYNHIFPLIDANLDKASCLSILDKNNIRLPEMYLKGYHNNNCIGCVRGGAGYWNKIRVDFPEHFKRMAEIEHKIGHSVLKQYYLDELPIEAGRNEKAIMPQCSIFCGFVDKEVSE